MRLLAMTAFAAAACAAGCGGHDAASRATPAESCRAPDADPALAADRTLPGAIPVGALTIYPADDLAPAPPGRVAAPKVVVITTGREPVTLTVGRSARRRFSLLFAGATTGREGTGFRVADGRAAVRFPACGGATMGFRGGFLYSGAQDVPVSVQAGHGPVVRATIAIGGGSPRRTQAVVPPERRCDSAVWGSLGRGWRQEPTTVQAGPVAFPVAGTYRGAPRRLFASWRGRYPGQKVLAVVDRGATVTLTIPPAERSRARLLYGVRGLSYRYHRLSAGTAAMRFVACGDSATQFNGGFLVTGPECVAVDVREDGQTRTYRARIPFGRRC